jgi:hypothetical protein
MTLWYVDTLLGNDRERNIYTTAVAEYWACKNGRLKSAAQ